MSPDITPPKFRQAVAADTDQICTILRLAVARMLADGKRQWDNNYPTRTHVAEDIANGIGYVIEHDERVIAYGAIVTDGEPAYAKIDGSWLSDRQYVVVHRMAVHPNSECRGIGLLFLQEAEKLALSQGITDFRIDTNFDNFRMLRLIEKFGFTYCGEIYYEGGVRKAFEKLLTS